MKVFKLFLKSLAGTLFFLLLLFAGAGQTAYWQGWLYAAVSILCLLLNTLALLDRPELVEERSAVRDGAKAWDKKILGLSALTLVFTYLTAGLDAGRYHWSPEYHPLINGLGILLVLVGELLYLLAQRVNRFFSAVVRIQADRGHAVCDSGIYAVVRHPAYLGMIVTSAGIPLALGSLWSFIPSALSMLLVVWRTRLEDKALHEELPGYREYAARVRFRLIPDLW